MSPLTRVTTVLVAMCLGMPVGQDARTVTHIVEGSMAPDWIGTKLVRSFRFLDPDRVELGVVPDAQLMATGLVLVWQRVR